MCYSVTAVYSLDVVGTAGSTVSTFGAFEINVKELPTHRESYFTTKPNGIYTTLFSALSTLSFILCIRGLGLRRELLGHSSAVAGCAYVVSLHNWKWKLLAVLK